MSKIHLSLDEIIEFTREWFEKELGKYFENRGLHYTISKQHWNKLQEQYTQGSESVISRPLLNDVDFVFLAGGTCKIPFIQGWIKKQFPKAESIIIIEKLEIITATGAAIHALQVLSGEVQPYLKVQHYNNKEKVPKLKPNKNILQNREQIMRRNQSNKYNNFIIRDWGFIHVPELVKEYESRIDIMGIDLGSTRCVLSVSRNREIRVIPIDNSAPGDLWTESTVSFDQKKPFIGKGAVRRLRIKPNSVIFDMKLLFYEYHRREKSNKSVWPFEFYFEEKKQYLEVMTPEGLKQFSLAEINKIFLEKMKEAASEYQKELNNEKCVKKAVITVPSYFWSGSAPNSIISTVIEAAKLADIEIIDIIEETHADLLYYMSNGGYFEKIKPGKKIAIFDIGGGTCICRIYEISEHNGKKYANCLGKLFTYNEEDANYSGRSIDDIIMKKLEEFIPEYLRSKVKLKTLETAKKIKHNLSFEEKIK